MASGAALVETDRGQGRARHGVGLAPRGRSAPGRVREGRDFNVSILGRIAMVSHDPTGHVFVFPMSAEAPYIAAVDLDGSPLADRALDALAWAAREAVISEARATSLIS